MLQPVLPQSGDDHSGRERIHFDRLAEQTGECWWGHRTPAAPFRMRRRAEMLRRHLQRFSNPRVLEIGCGTGIFTEAVLSCMPGLDLVAIDISPKAAQLARRRCRPFSGVQIEVGDIVAGVPEASCFDAIIGNSVLHHILLDDYLPKAMHTLRPGGLFWTSEPNMLNPQVAIERNIRPLGRLLENSPDETAFIRWRLRRRLVDAGFAHVRVRPFDFVHPILPGFCLAAVARFSRALESVPGIREIAGSLEVAAYKPA